MTVIWLSTSKNHRYGVVASGGIHRQKRDKNKLRQQMVIKRKRRFHRQSRKTSTVNLGAPRQR